MRDTGKKYVGTQTSSLVLYKPSTGALGECRLAWLWLGGRAVTLCAWSTPKNLPMPQHRPPLLQTWPRHCSSSISPWHIVCIVRLLCLSFLSTDSPQQFVPCGQHISKEVTPPGQLLPPAQGARGTPIFSPSAAEFSSQPKGWVFSLPFFKPFCLKINKHIIET